MKRKIAIYLIVLFILSISLTLAGCNSKNTSSGEVKKVDKAKAQFYISNFNGGVGHDWLDAHIKRFEEMYADTEFIPGKKGVQVWITNHKSGMVELSSKFNTALEDIYFLEKVNYYDAIAQDFFLDITDWVTTPLTEYGENASIEDKLYDSQISFYKTPNGKYYGVPHAQSPTMITYDADLFNKLGLFFGSDGKLGKKSTDSNLSVGPDGKNGTYDDGLPATYDDFYTLCQTMKKRGVAPMIWSGKYPFYMTRFAATLRADYDGSEASIPYSFNGTATHLINIDNNGNITKKDPLEITERNGYEFYQSASYYNTFKFFETIYKNQYYSTSKSFNEGFSHSDAQSTFLLSSFTSEQDIGMLVEGLYWVNEAKPMFREMESFPNSSIKDRNLKVMPLPKATQEMVGQKTTLVDSLNQLAFVRKNISSENLPIAKAFIRFISTQQSLEEFVLQTGLTRNFKVDYSNIYNELSPYTRSIIDMLKECDYIMPQSSAEVFRKNYTALYNEYQMGTVNHPDPMMAIKDGITAEQLSREFSTKYNENSWMKLFD